MKTTLTVVGACLGLAAIFFLTFHVLSSLDQDPLPGYSFDGSLSVSIPEQEAAPDLRPTPRDDRPPEPFVPAVEPGPEALVEPEPGPDLPADAGTPAPEPLVDAEPAVTPEVPAVTAEAVATRPGYVTLGGEMVTWMTIRGELLFPGQGDGEGMGFSTGNDGLIVFPADLPLVSCDVVLRLGQGLAPRVALEIPPPPTDIVIPLDAYLIAGEVRYAGRAIDGATVRLVDTEDFEKVYDTQVSDVYGRFSFGPLFRGQYRVECAPPPDRDDLAGVAFNMHIANNHDDVIVEMEEAGRLRGTLFDPRGQPVLQGSVVAHDMEGIVPPGGKVEVFGDGSFELVGLGSGIYELTGYGSPPLAVKERAQVKAGATLEHDLHLQSGGGLRVVVENARNEPQVGCAVFVTPMGMTPEPPLGWDPPATGEDGTSLVTSLAPGDYFVTAELGVRRAISGMLRVESGDMRDVRLELPD